MGDKLRKSQKEMSRDKAEEEQVRGGKDVLLLGLLLGRQVIGARTSWGSNQLGDPS